MSKITFFVADKLFALLYYTVLLVVFVLESIVKVAPYALIAFALTLFIILVMSNMGVL